MRGNQTPTIPRGRPQKSEPTSAHGRALRLLRQQAGMSMADLSERVYGKRNHASIHHYEVSKAHVMSEGTIYRLAAGLGITPRRFKEEIARQKELEKENHEQEPQQ